MLIRFVKSLEIAIMVLALAASRRRTCPALLACTFLLGLHSTLFGPVKYAYLPQHLNERELTGGNGMVEMGTFVAILLGNVVGGLLIAMPEVGPELRGLELPRPWPCSAASSAQFVPSAPATDAGLTINWNPFTETWRNLKLAHEQRRRVPLAAGHLVDVVLRRGVPDAVPGLREGRAGRQRAGRLAAAGGVLDRHRDRLAAVRDALAPPRRDRPGAARRASA